MRRVQPHVGVGHVERFDLFHVHNLLAWETHLPRLHALQAAGRVRYVGATTSHGRRHDEMEAFLRSQRVDFVQFTQNLLEREVEKRLLPTAAEKGVAVVINRPFSGGSLIDRFAGKPLPPWAGEIGCRTWPQFLLKFVVSHPAVTCAIPATSNPEHMSENMAALRGPLPDPATRARMIAWAEAH